MYFKDKNFARWQRSLARGSLITAEVALRMLGKVCELLDLDPLEIVREARRNLMVFQDDLEDVITKLEDEKIPSQEELAKIFRVVSPRIRSAIALIAFSNLRPMSIGNHNGSDGLMIKDLPELRIEKKKKKVKFEKIPTRIIVRAPLSKARHKYFTFLCEEGCIYT